MKRLHKVDILLKALKKTLDSGKFIEEANFHVMKERNKGSDSDVRRKSFRSGEDKIIIKGP